MTDAKAVARELYRRVTAPCHYPSEPMDEKEARIELITAALDARELAVWEQAARYATECEAVETERSFILAWHKIAAWCRRQGGQP